MTYLWFPAVGITMQLHDGRLIAFHWHDREHGILLVTQHWRIDVAWWRVRMWRDYYRLVTDSGYLVLVYHDLLHQRWYLQKLYD
ncbi:MAG: hypothetical protein AAFR67_02870 [Chloroflexota bacterium]